MSRALPLLLLVPLLAAFVVPSCGGRTIGAEGFTDPGTGGCPCGDGGAGGGGGSDGGGGEGGGTGGEAAAGGTGGEGGGSVTPIDCLACIGMNCPAVLDCLLDTNCRNGLVCTLTQCMSGGQPDPMCAIECFGGDFTAAQQAMDAMVCIFTTCSDECGGMLPI